MGFDKYTISKNYQKTVKKLSKAFYQADLEFYPIRTLRRQTAGATDHPAGGSEENVPPINGETAASP